MSKLPAGWDRGVGAGEYGVGKREEVSYLDVNGGGESWLGLAKVLPCYGC